MHQMETNKSTWGQKLSAFKRDFKRSLCSTALLSHTHSFHHHPLFWFVMFAFIMAVSFFRPSLLLWSVFSLLSFPFHRERDRELHGPKKRGPKPKNFVLKVHFCILTGSNGILWTLQHISSWKRILPMSIFFNCSHDLLIHYLPVLIQQHVTGSGEVPFFFK